MKYVYYLLFFTILYSSCFSSKNTEKKYEDLETNQYTFEYIEWQDTYYHLNDLTYFINFPTIKTVKLYTGTFFDLTPLTMLHDLEELEIIANDYIYDITPLASLSKLIKLTLINNENINNIDAISLLQSLNYLAISYNDRYYKEFVPLNNLEVLILHSSERGNIDLTYIAMLKSLKELTVNPDTIIYPYNIDNILNIVQLKNLINLEKLTISSVGDLDLSWITHLQKLVYLDFKWCTINDISPLAELPNLVEVDLFQSEVRDITPLLDSSSIRKISGLIVENETPELFQQFRERNIDFSTYTSNR